MYRRYILSQLSALQPDKQQLQCTSSLLSRWLVSNNFPSFSNCIASEADTRGVQLKTARQHWHLYHSAQMIHGTSGDPATVARAISAACQGRPVSRLNNTFPESKQLPLRSLPHLWESSQRELSFSLGLKLLPSSVYRARLDPQPRLRLCVRRRRRFRVDRSRVVWLALLRAWPIMGETMCRRMLLHMRWRAF